MKSRILHLAQTSVYQVKIQPPSTVVAFLGGFSAPVKVDYTQNDQELEIIMLSATDEFCRWDAGQKLLTTYIKALLADPELILSEKLLSIFSQVLISDIDNALKAEQLTLPTFDEIAAVITEVDPVKLIEAIEQLKYFLAKGLNDKFVDIYRQCLTSSYSNDKVAIGQRALKNVCLSYLGMLDGSDEVVERHYNSSDNMTDTLAALSASAKNSLACYNQQMQTFEQKWQDTSLVMDKWFVQIGVSPSESCLTVVKETLEHGSFSLANPNRTRSLIGSFSALNTKAFHAIDGSGYVFLTDILCKLNSSNPQVASRLITPLIEFKKFDSTRQALMKAQLIRLSKIDALAADLFEKIDRALA